MALRTTINHRQLLHADLGVWTAEASDLGLAPGAWPNEIHVIFEADTRVYSGASPFYTGQGEDRELAGVEYRRPGSLLRIFND